MLVRATEKFDAYVTPYLFSRFFLFVCLVTVHQWLAKSNEHYSLVMYIVAIGYESVAC